MDVQASPHAEEKKPGSRADCGTGPGLFVMAGGLFSLAGFRKARSEPSGRSYLS